MDENTEPAAGGKSQARKKTPRSVLADRRQLKQRLRELEAKVEDTEQFYRDENARLAAKADQLERDNTTMRAQLEAITAERDEAQLERERLAKELDEARTQLARERQTKESLVQHNFRQLCASALFE